MTRRPVTLGLALALAITAMPSSADAQSAPKVVPLEIGSVAPDFSLPGATRYGLLQKPVRLSDFRGQTVVLAFFPQARSRG